MQLGVLEYLISVDNSKLKKGLKESDNAVKDSGKGMSAWMVAKGQALERVAEKAIKATGNFVKGAVQETMSFDASMSQVAATLGKTVDEMNKEIKSTDTAFGHFSGTLSDFARFMGANTAYTAEEAAQALNYMALAGYDTDKSMRMLPQVLNLAAAGNFDLARASDMVTDAQSALGLTMEGTETLVDQMAKTASKSNTSVEQLGDAILTVGGTAKMMGEDTYQLAGVLGILADNGIKGSEGGTALRNVLLSLSAPTDKASKQLQKLGVQVFDADGNLRNMEDIMLDMGAAMDGMTSEERTDIISDIFNKRDLKSVEALLGTSKERWEELYAAIDDSKGAAQEMAETQLDNLAGDVTKFKSALGEAKISLVEGLTPSLRKFVKSGTMMLTRFTTAFKEKGIKGIWEETKKTFGMMRTAMAKWLKLDNAEDASWWDIGVAFGKKLFSGIKNGLGNIKTSLANWLKIEDAKSASWWDVGLALGKKLIAGIKKGIGEVKNSLAKWLGLTDDTGEISADWADIGSKLIDKLGSGANKAGNFLKQLILGDEYNEASTWKDVGDKIVNWISEAFEEGGLLNKLLDMAGTKVGLIANFVGEFAKQFAIWVKGHVSDIVAIAKNIIEAIKKALPALIDALVELIPSLVEVFTELLTELVPAIITVVDKLFSDSKFMGSMVKLAETFAKAIYELIFGGGGPSTEEADAQVSDAMGVAHKPVNTKEPGHGVQYDDVSEGMTAEDIESGKSKKRTEPIQPLKGVWEILKHPELANPSGNALGYALSTVEATKFGGIKGAVANTLLYPIIAGIKDLNSEYFKKNKQYFEDLDTALNGGEKRSDFEKAWGRLKTSVNETADNLKEKAGQAGIDLAIDVVNGAKDFKNFVVQAGADVAAYFAGISIGGDRGSEGTGGDFVSARSFGGDRNVWRNGRVESYNAKGNWAVPYDNFPALLHRDEMVLTKSQARRYRDGELGNGGISGDMLASAVEAAMSRVYVMLSGEKVGDLTTKRIKKNINASSYARMRALGG